MGPSSEVGLLRLSGGLERKLFAHSGRRVAYSVDCACKLLFCHAEMLGPVPELIFAIDDNLTAVAGDACVSFKIIWVSCDGSENRFSRQRPRISFCSCTDSLPMPQGIPTLCLFTCFRAAFEQWFKTEKRLHEFSVADLRDLEFTESIRSSENHSGPKACRRSQVSLRSPLENGSELPTRSSMRFAPRPYHRSIGSNGQGGGRHFAKRETACPARLAEVMHANSVRTTFSHK
jgi:hypothetical protein